MSRPASLALSFVLALPSLLVLPAAGAGPATTPQQEYLAELDWAAERLTGLAGAIPGDRYGWRPAEEVRSVGEVLQHVSQSIYYLTRRVGAEPPAGEKGEPPGLAEGASKEEIVAEIERALAHARAALESASAEALEREVELFGRKTTARRVHLRLLVHVNEHAGQLVAYARSIGVVPPWSRSE